LRLPLEEGEVRGHFWQDVAIDASIISPTPRMLPIATILRNGGNSLRANRRRCLSDDTSADVEPPGEFGKPEIRDLAEPIPVGILPGTALVWDGLLARVPQPNY
jgi:hypothetical protein